MWKWLA